MNIPFIEDYGPVTKKLTLRGATYLPSEVFDFNKEHPIKILDASVGEISELPGRFAELKDLEVAFFSDQAFEEIPSVLSELENLYMAAFKSCNLSKFPEDRSEEHTSELQSH